jgi:hypothetical protein
MRRLLWVFVVLSLVAASCGGGSDTDDSVGGTASESAEADSEQSQPASQQTEEDETGLADSSGADGQISVYALEPNQEVRAAAEALVGELGAEAALGAVLLAVDAGYTAEQLLRASSSGGLQVDGSITSGDEAVEPDGAPANLIVEPLSESSMSVNGQEYEIVLIGGERIDLTLDQFVKKAVESLNEARARGEVPGDDFEVIVSKDTSILLTWALIKLLETGFTAEQAMSAILLGATWVASDDTDDCIALVYPDGEVIPSSQNLARCPSFSPSEQEGGEDGTAEIEPAGEPEGGSDEPPTSDVPTALAFSGDGSITLIYNEPGGECETTIPVNIDLSLNPDGTATLGFSDWPIQGIREAPPSTLTECYALGKPRIYSGFWFDRRAEVEAGLDLPPGEEDAAPIEAGFNVPNTAVSETDGSIGAIEVVATDECAWSASNFADSVFPRRFIINFGIPEGCN